MQLEEEIELDDQAKIAIEQLDEYFDREYFYQNRKRTTENYSHGFQLPLQLQ
ncbi:hypothetical protein KUH03_29270 [Sphingobacterium sp. E70]|uniref:hypothetical protein n=1 Tax=Sphingobacterium sp. E70 TaxID=2853439 RepID=UPI00211BAA8B|nr:hypothetical protein [Sphingobacterium sp. E70]ULT23272.1 hypothetical protein KUH03_29270 [Sphingobacterium sp. E70]